MAPTSLGGRPRLSWTASRNRKLARMWILADITIEEIKEVFEEIEGGHFSPSARSISSQIGLLLPNNRKNWRQYRPKGISQMKTRLGQLNVSRQQHKQRKTGRYIRLENSITTSERAIKGSTVQEFSINTKLDCAYNPSMSECDNHFYSDKEVVVTEAPEVYRARELNSIGGRLGTEHAIQAEDNLQNSTETACEEEPATHISSSENNTPKYELSAVGKANNLPKTRSTGFQSMRDFTSSKLSRSISHVESVLSATNSWRSSLISSISSSSRRSQISARLGLSESERMTWNELVDETKFDSEDQIQTRPSDYQEISLTNRPCCGLSAENCLYNFKCSTCFFSSFHARARTSTIDIIQPTPLDRFGNTPLHHAAAAGNYPATVKLLSLSGTENQVLNSSGETYMHVLGTAKKMVFSEFLSILETASKQGFDFLSLDHSGKTAASRLYDTAFSWKLEIDYIHLSKTLLTACGVPIPCDIPDAIQTFTRHSEIDENGNTELIAVLKNWGQNPIPLSDISNLVKKSNIHIRDRRGYTALSLAIHHGLEEAVALLLSQGANPNTRTYHKNSVLTHATVRLAQAQQDGQDSLYAQILSCIAFLVDAGGKAQVSVIEEFTAPYSKPQSTLSSKINEGIERKLNVLASANALVGASDKNEIMDVRAKATEFQHGSFLLHDFRTKAASGPAVADSYPSSLRIQENNFYDNSVKSSKSNRQFLNWVAYTRNLSPRISETERRTCPLIGCEVLFDHADRMLIHLKTCPFLLRRERRYICLDTGNLESIGKCQSQGCRDLYQGKLATLYKSIEKRFIPRKPNVRQRLLSTGRETLITGYNSLIDRPTRRTESAQITTFSCGVISTPLPERFNEISIAELQNTSVREMGTLLSPQGLLHELSDTSIYEMQALPSIAEMPQGPTLNFGALNDWGPTDSMSSFSTNDYRLLYEPPTMATSCGFQGPEIYAGPYIFEQGRDWQGGPSTMCPTPNLTISSAIGGPLLPVTGTILPPYPIHGTVPIPEEYPSTPLVAHQTRADLVYRRLNMKDNMRKSIYGNNRPNLQIHPKTSRRFRSNSPYSQRPPPWKYKLPERDKSSHSTWSPTCPLPVIKENHQPPPGMLKDCLLNKPYLDNGLRPAQHEILPGYKCGYNPSGKTSNEPEISEVLEGTKILASRSNRKSYRCPFPGCDKSFRGKF